MKVFVAILAASSVVLSAAAQNQNPGTRNPEPGTAASTHPARALVTQYCVACHNDKLKTAGLDLTRADAEQVFNSQDTWEKVIVQLRSRAMPPPGRRRPDNST